MYTLYYSPGSCAMAIHIVLNELGQQVELKPVNLQAPRDPEFLKINPRGNVPVLVDGDTVIREGGAIITYLLDKHKSPMLPKSGAARARALEWLMFGNSTLHPTYGKGFFVMKSAVLDDAGRAPLYKEVEAQINKLWADVDTQLTNQPYVCGKDMTAGDILLAVIANWAYFPVEIKLGTHVKRMIRDVSNRPAFQKALAAEKVEYKAAA